MRFHKMHGLGNDFIMINNMDSKNLNWSEIAIDMCHRHFGIGADGIILIEKSNCEDVKMRIFNSDGSIAEMCGNGIRCFAKYVYEMGILKEDVIKIETLAGRMIAELSISNGKVDGVKINMGSPDFKKENIVFKSEMDNIIYEIQIEDKVYKASTVLMGVPHTILYVNKIDEDEIIKYGSKIEKMDIFPLKTNVNFVRIIDRDNIEIRTWERGAGITMACGTGTCAAVVLCSKNNFTNSKVSAHLVSGDMYIDYTGDIVFMKGPAEFICEGEFYK